MEVPKVFESEYRLCLILWEHEPIKSSELVQLCREQLGWKPTTTYTVIKRLAQRGVLVNENTVVRSLVSKDQVQDAEIDEMVENPLMAPAEWIKRCRSLESLRISSLYFIKIMVIKAKKPALKKHSLLDSVLVHQPKQ